MSFCHVARMDGTDKCGVAGNHYEDNKEFTNV
jgi:hypothetical protein